MDLGLVGKYALVTASSRGIGKTTAISLAKEGVNVAICARNQTKLSEVEKEIKKYDVQCISIAADLTSKEGPQTVMNSIREQWGKLDILVNNAGGIIDAPSKNIEEVPVDFWNQIHNLNSGLAIQFTNFAIPFMKKNKWGRVVTISSKQGKEGGGLPWYTMTKSAEIAMMKTYAMKFELVREGITFNTVAPGAILTEEGNWADFLKKEPQKLEERLKSTFPLARLGTTQEVADVILFLCSQKASLVNGACIPVDGAESKSY